MNMRSYLFKMHLYICLIMESIQRFGILKTVANASIHIIKAFPKKTFIIKKEELIPVYIDLQNLKVVKFPLDRFDCKIKLVTKKDLINLPKFKYTSRKIKALFYLKSNYAGFLLLKSNTVIGDIWFISNLETDNLTARTHQDLNNLNINFDHNNAYAFDMYIDETLRGKDLATSFMLTILWELRNRGINRVHGYYMKTNLRALWIHRLIGYKEYKTIKIKKIFFWRINRTENYNK